MATRSIDPFVPAQIRRLVKQFGSPLMILDCARLRRQYRALRRALPGVDLHYALKPLPHPAVVRTLMDEGAWFDVATTGEVQLIDRVGVDPGRCIHTHPIKRLQDIRNALHYGVDTFVVDNPDEVRKFRPWADKVKLLIRVAFSSPGASIDLSRKFGVDPTEALSLGQLAASLGLDVRGFSFHVGSQLKDAQMQVQAIATCTNLIARARALKLGSYDTLDIGGGFPVGYDGTVTDIARFCGPIRRALRDVPRRIRVIAEPGRFLVGPCATGVARVMGRAKRQGRWWYYLDDGVYGLYSGHMWDHVRYPARVLEPRSGPTFPSVLAGPTCDSIDVIAEDLRLPLLRDGDLVVSGVMGAYTWSTASEFNFFPKPTIVAVNRHAGDLGGVEN